MVFAWAANTSCSLNDNSCVKAHWNLPSGIGRVKQSVALLLMRFCPAQRHSPRLCPHDVTVEIELDETGKTCQCRVVDLSMHGLGCLDCEAKANLPKNSNLVIWLSQGSEELLPINGKIVHRHDYGAFRHLGIEFEPELAEMVGIGALMQHT